MFLVSGSLHRLSIAQTCVIACAVRYSLSLLLVNAGPAFPGFDIQIQGLSTVNGAGILPEFCKWSTTRACGSK